MKKLLLIVMLVPSLSWAQAQVNVINMIRSVQVQVYNPSQKNILCQGLVNIHYEQEGFVNEYFRAYITPQMTATQTYLPRRLNDIVYSANHNISCFKQELN